MRIGRRRGRDSDVALSPLELALRPALVDGRWQIPDRFNFTRDVVEALARDPKRRALTSLGKEGVIEHRSFLEISDGAAVWATTLRENGVTPGDRVIVVAGNTVDWLEIVLGVMKTGAVVVPCMPSISASMLERQVSSTDAALVVAERALEPTIERMGFTPDAHFFDDSAGVKRSSKDIPAAATHDTASRDLAFIVSTPGVGGTRKDVAHTHGSAFATRVQAEHWLDVGRGDAVWCTTDAASPLTMWNTVIGPWSRGAEVVLHEGEFDADERLDLMFRLGPSILCQSPAEYGALAAHPKLERFRSPRLRRLVSTGDFLDPEVVAVFEERWGTDHLRRLRPGRDEHRRGASRRRRVSARLARPRASRPPRRDHRRPGQRASRRASRATSPSAAGRRRCSPATGSFRRRRSPPSWATGTSPATSRTSTRRASSRSSGARRT